MIIHSNSFYNHVFNLALSSLDSLTLKTGEYTDAVLTITPPADTPLGTDVTLTMEVKSSTGADSNYIVLRFSVVDKVTRLDNTVGKNEKNKQTNKHKKC